MRVKSANYGSVTPYFFEANRRTKYKDGYPVYRLGNGPFSFIDSLQDVYRIRAPPFSCFRSDMKRLEDERMKEKHTDSVQNRFTAYLVAAVGNTRKKYWERKYRLQGREFAQEDLLDRKYTDFEEQYRAYVGEHTDFIFRDWRRFEELLAILESNHLARAISRLRERDRVLLFARIYGELTFAELGEQFQMEPKQAEMAYYYVLRKLRKELKGKDEF